MAFCGIFASLSDQETSANLVHFPLWRGTRQIVPSRDVGGYVQLTPGDGASRQQLAELLKKTGPVGGPLACIGNVGSPAGPQMTAVSMDVSIKKTGPDAELVAALRGSLALPKEGARTIAKQVGTGLPAALDHSRQAGMPGGLLACASTGTIVDVSEIVHSPRFWVRVAHRSSEPSARVRAGMIAG